MVIPLIVYKAAKRFAHKVQTSATSYLIVSHTDADGATSAAILSLALRGLNYKHKIIFVERAELGLTDIVEKARDFDGIIFSDLGDAVDIANDVLSKTDKKIFIVDHHEVPRHISLDPSITFFNIENFGLSGDTHASCSAMAFLLSRYLIGRDDPLIAKLSLVGASGDLQPMKMLNALPVPVLKRFNVGKVISCPDSFGLSQTIRTLLSNYLRDKGRSYAMYMVDMILQEANVDSHARWHTLDDATISNLKSLLRKRVSIEFKDNIIFTDEDPRSPFSNPDEFSTVINDCIRIGLKKGGAELALDICYGNRDKTIMDKLESFRKKRSATLGEILAAIKCGDLPISQEFPHVQFLNLGSKYADRLPYKLASTVSTMLVTGDFPAVSPYKYLLVFSTLNSKFSKVSIRVPERIRNRILQRSSVFPGINEIISELIPDYVKSGGGHLVAGGAVVPLEKVLDMITAFNRVVEERFGKELRLEASAFAAMKLARRQIDGSMITEFYTKKTGYYSPGEKAHLCVTITPIGEKIDIEKDLLPYIGNVYVYLKQTGKTELRHIFLAKNRFIDRNSIYFYTNEIELPQDISGTLKVIPLVELVKPGIRDIFTLDYTIHTINYDRFKWSIERDFLLYAGIYSYLWKQRARPKDYAIRYSYYVSPSKISTIDPAERAIKVRQTTATPPDCIPLHELKAALPSEIQLIAKEYGIPEKDKRNTLNRLEKRDFVRLIRELAYLNLISTPFYGVVSDKGKIYNEYLARVCGNYVLPPPKKKESS